MEYLQALLERLLEALALAEIPLEARSEVTRSVDEVVAEVRAERRRRFDRLRLRLIQSRILSYLESLGSKLKEAELLGVTSEISFQIRDLAEILRRGELLPY